MTAAIMQEPPSTILSLRMGLCAALGAAAFAWPVSEANAVVVTTFANTSIAVPANGDGIYINLTTGATGTSAASVPGWDINMFLGNSVFTFFWNNTAPSVSGGVATAVTGGSYFDMPVGSVVAPTLLFSADSGGAGASATFAFQSAGTHILGVRFRNETTASTNYGFITITNSAPNGFPATVNGWMFENSGGAITVVPEPSTYALMFAGLAALGGMAARRRKLDAVA